MQITKYVTIDIFKKVIKINNSISKLNEKIITLTNEIGDKNKVVVKKFYLGKSTNMQGAVIYINGIVNKEIVDRDIIKPLMTEVQENILEHKDPCTYLCEKYIYASDVNIEININKAISAIREGKTALIIDEIPDFILIDTTSFLTKGTTEPMNEATIRGSKEGFVQNIKINLGIIKRHIKDKNLSTEMFVVGNRTQTNLAMVYIEDIVDKDILKQIKKRINSINIDSVQGAGIVEQLIEDHPYTLFPQVLNTENTDRVVGNILEGKIAIIIEGTPFVSILPVTTTAFLQAPEDYFQRTLLSTFIRLLRILAIVMVITLPSIYLILIRFNSELIPIKLIIPIIQSRKGIPLPPLLEIISMEIVLEFLREGGLRLPSKIGQTISVVGGFIIGDAAIRARIVSPTTLVIVGAAAIATFVIPNYEMSLSVRLLRFPMLILSNLFGILGFTAGIYLLIVHLYSLESFGIPYFVLNKSKDHKDILIRAPIWKMNKRPESIPNNNPIRQTDFKKSLGEKNK